MVLVLREVVVRYISGVEAAAEAPVEPDLPPVPTTRRQPTCSGCGKKGIRSINAKRELFSQFYVVLCSEIVPENSI
jgi:hypothetical protein